MMAPAMPPRSAPLTEEGRKICACTEVSASRAKPRAMGVFMVGAGCATAPAAQGFKQGGAPRGLGAPGRSWHFVNLEQRRAGSGAADRSDHYAVVAGRERGDE